MTMEAEPLAYAAAIGAAVLVVGVAIFQAALALGLPLGEATLGGKARTVDGVLQGIFRLLAAVQSVILLLVAWIIVARVGVIDFPVFGDQFLFWATWGIVGFLVINTLANLTAPHPVERWLMGTVTLVVAILVVGVALLGPTT